MVQVTLNYFIQVRVSMKIQPSIQPNRRSFLEGVMIIHVNLDIEMILDFRQI